MLILDIVLGFFIILILLMLATAITSLLIRVPYVPSNKKTVKHMVELANLKPGQKVYDLGCGDGRFLIEAQKKTKNKTIGFEAAPIPYLLAQIKKFIFNANIQVSMRNFFNANLSDADVIFCYLGPDIMEKLAEKFKNECRKGTRIFSSTFHMEGMEPIKVWPKDKQKKLPTIYLYQI